MQKCHLTITTETDGKEERFSRDGELYLSPLKTTVCYREENAQVSLSLENNRAIVERKGDYEMSLSLFEGETTEGSLGIAGANGRISTRTHRVAYSTTKEALLLSLHYDVLFGTEIQRMRLRLYARVK